MAPVSRYPTRLLLTALLLQLAAGAAGVWLFVSEAEHGADARRRCDNIAAMANLHSCLTDADRTMLFAVIQADQLHPDLPVSFRTCIERARQECRNAQTNAAVPGEKEELGRLAAQLEEVARRGEQLLAALPEERQHLYHTPGSGFQTATTTAWRHLCHVRAVNEVALEYHHRAAWRADPWATRAVAGFGSLSLLLTVVALWRHSSLFRRTNPGSTASPG